MRALSLAVAAACLTACGQAVEFRSVARSEASRDDLTHAVWRQLPVAVDRSGGSFLSTTAVWAGDQLVVIHGADGQSENIVGEVYDLERGLVTRTTSPLPWGAGPAAVWTGTEVVVLGCCAVQQAVTDAAAYDPARDRWRRLARSPSPGSEAAVWTGREMLAWGSFADDRVGVLAYDPVADRWRRGRAAPLSGRGSGATVWTGRELVIWGGCLDIRLCQPLADGAAYDPALDRWRPLPPAPIEGLGETRGVWTGSEMIVWGGRSDSLPGGAAIGAAYDPVADRWRALPAAPIAGRSSHMMVWTGREVLVWDGATAAAAGGLAGDGARYDPATNRWTLMPALFPGTVGPGLRRAGAGVWTPFGLVVTGGYPSSDTWLLTAPRQPMSLLLTGMMRDEGVQPGRGERPCSLW